MLALAVNFAAPVYAHTTLGNLNGTGPLYRSNDNELNPTNTNLGRHVPGPLGYVWPGSGLNTYSGTTSYPPGYQSPFTTFENPIQVAGHAYAPEGAILTSTINHDNVGDLIFAINFSDPLAYTPNQNFVYSSIAIYIPAPVFDKTGALVQDGFEPAGGLNWDTGENTNIVTTITNNYGNIFVTRADRNDPFGPGDWILYITAPITFTAARNWTEWYYIRVNQMRAPQVAGRYFFKIFLDNHYPVRSQGNPPHQQHNADGELARSASERRGGPGDNLGNSQIRRHKQLTLRPSFEPGWHGQSNRNRNRSIDRTIDWSRRGSERILQRHISGSFRS